MKDPREFIFEVLLASNRLADGVLAGRSKGGRRAASSTTTCYFEAFAKEQFAVLERRLNDAITAVASMIIGAWDAAGRPPIPPERRAIPASGAKPKPQG